MKGLNKKFKEGFSMIEVIISVFVLSAGLVAVIGLISNSIEHSIDSRDHIIASELAQEGIELAINIRDNNWASASLGSFDNFPATDQVNCRIDKNYLYPTLISCGFTADNLKLNYSSNFYIHGAGEATKFSRKIDISNYGTFGKKIVITVIWGNSFPVICNVANKCAYAEIILTNWDA